MAKKNEAATRNENISFAQTIAPVDISKLKLKAHVVMPTLSIKGVNEGDTLLVKMLSELSSQDQTKEDGSPALNEAGHVKQIHTVNAVNLQTGEYGNMVVGIVAFNGLKNCGEITGRMFALRKIKATVGKTTAWEVCEIYLME